MELALLAAEGAVTIPQPRSEGGGNWSQEKCGQDSYLGRRNILVAESVDFTQTEAAILSCWIMWKWDRICSGTIDYIHITATPGLYYCLDSALFRPATVSKYINR